MFATKLMCICKSNLNRCWSNDKVRGPSKGSMWSTWELLPAGGDTRD